MDTNKELVISHPVAPNRKVAAILKQEGGRTILVPEEPLERPSGAKVVDKYIEIPGGPRHDAINYKPRTLWGEMESRKVTFLDSHMRNSFSAPITSGFVYDISSMLVGDCIQGWDEECRGIRFSFNIKSPAWMRDEKIKEKGFTWTPWSSGSFAGLSIELDEPVALRSIVRDVPIAVKPLIQLWFGSEICIPTVEVSINGAEWFPIFGVVGEPVKPVEAEAVSSKFLPSLHLHLGEVVNWYIRSRPLGAIPHIAVDHDSPLQSAVQLIAASLEGLHVRTSSKKLSTGFDHLQSKKMKEAKEAIIRLGVDHLSEIVDEGIAKTALSNSLNHLGGMTFQERLEDLVAPVDRIAPGLMGEDFHRWVSMIKKIRNIQSHGGAADDELTEHMISRYVALLLSGRWVLKLLLLRIIVTDDYLQSQLMKCNSFLYTLGNIDTEEHLGVNCLQRFTESSG